jgi:hypothetical protein
MLSVAASTACTNATCTAGFPTFCPANKYVSANYVTWAAAGGEAKGMMSLTPVSCGSAAICYGIQLACNANSPQGLCPSFMTGTTIYYASCWPANSTGGAAAQCTAAGIGASQVGATAVVTCNTALCNTAAAAKSASSHLATPAFTILALIASIAATAM